jgi:hypothetical protein
MRKSVTISKYEIEWQILRSSLKGKFNDNLELKLEKVFDYYNQTSTLDRWERVVNWLEGFQRAIKDLIKRQRIQEEINFYKSLQPKEEKSLTIQEQDFKKYSLKERVDLWKDLFNTNKKWLMNGYFHKECNLFLDSLFSSFEIEVKPSYQKLLILRGLKPKINNHNFFF